MSTQQPNVSEHRPQDTFESGDRRQGFGIMSDAQAAGYQAGFTGKEIAQLGNKLPDALNAKAAIDRGDWRGAVGSIEAAGKDAPAIKEGLEKQLDKLVPQDIKDGLDKLGVGASEIWRLGGKMNAAVDLVNQMKAGNSVAAFDALSKVVGDPNLKTKIESQLGLPAGGLDAALQKNLINLGGLKLSDVIGQTTPDGKVGPSSVPLTGQEIAGGSFDVGGSVFHAAGSVGKPGDVFQAQGSIDLLKAQAYGSGSVKFDPSNFTFGATGKVGAKLDLLDAQGSTSLNYGIGSTQASGNIHVGANAEAQGTVAVDPKHGTLAADLDAEAFAGVQAGAKISQTIGPVAADAKASVSAGVGVDFGLDVGFQKGKFRSGVLHYHLAQNLIRVDRHKEAVEHLRRAIELHPLYPNSYRLLAKILCLLGRPRDARELLEKGLKGIPGDAALREELVNALVLTGDVAAAAKLAEEIAHSRPEDPVAQANRAVTLLAQGRVGDALKALKEAQGRGVVSGAMKLAEGMALQAMNPPDVAGALRAYEEGMALDPDGWEAANNLGLLLLQQGEPKAQAVERAVTVLAEAMRRSPSQPEVLLNLALAHVRKNERPRALELAQKVVLLDLPKDNPAREQAERLVAKLAPKA